MTAAASDPRPIRIGISSCLLGEAVRLDGGHKRDAFLAGTFGRFAEWVPDAPRARRGGVRLLSQLDTYAKRRVRELASENLSGCGAAAQRTRSTQFETELGICVPREYFLTVGVRV